MADLFDDQNLRPMLEAAQRWAKIQADAEKINNLVNSTHIQQHLKFLKSSALQQQIRFMKAIEPTFQQYTVTHYTLEAFLAFRYFSRLEADLLQEPEEHEVFALSETGLLLPETRERIIIYSPAQQLLEELRAQKISLHDIHWRDFEKVVAELLHQNGYMVELGPGTKDGGKDIVAIKDVPGCGLVMSVWQAKALQQGNKVDVHVIRELADTRVQTKASKGVIVTTTSLTRGALERIEQDRYLLHKVDGDDLLTWIRRTQGPEQGKA